MTDPSPFYSVDVAVCNEKGLHARPAAAFVRLATGFDADIYVSAGGERVEGDSVLNLLMLMAARGTVLTIETRGKQAAEALEVLRKLVEDGFGENVEGRP